jgi:hypothetical protein
LPPEAGSSPSGLDMEWIQWLLRFRTSLLPRSYSSPSLVKASCALLNALSCHIEVASVTHQSRVLHPWHQFWYFNLFTKSHKKKIVTLLWSVTLECNEKPKEKNRERFIEELWENMKELWKILKD